MNLADFRLLVSGVVFLFLNILVLLIYREVIRVAPSSTTQENVDVIFVANGRQRVAIQHQVWLKYWKSLDTTRFLVLHLAGVDEEAVDTNTGLTHINTPYTTERDMFIHVASIVPADNTRSPFFLWASDKVIPLRDVEQNIFRRSKTGARFFSGFEPDAVLFNAQRLFEPTIPVTVTRYEKSVFQSYDEFLIHFLSGKHRLFSNIAQQLVLPNLENKAKRPLARESFMVAHISPSDPNQASLNDVLKNIWTSKLG